MAKPGKAVMAFMEKYGVESEEIWPVPGGKQYAIMHKALQRIAREQHIMLTVNAVEQLCNIEQGFAVVKAFGKLGDEFVESYGEASPKNNRNQYPLAMAQKRAEDRVILGLLSVYGDVYSEEEADDFKRKPQQTMPDEFDPAEPVPDEHLIPRADGVQVLTVDAQRPIFSELEKELLRSDTVEQLKRWKLSAKTRAARLSDHWRTELNNRYLTYLRQLERQEANEYIERETG